MVRGSGIQASITIYILVCIGVCLFVEASPQRQRYRVKTRVSRQQKQIKQLQYDGLSVPNKGLSSYDDETQLQKLGEPQQELNEPPNYDFRYEVHGGGNLFGHGESRKDYSASGQYHVILPDGRKQTVTYYADETGYHPTVTYEVLPDQPKASPVANRGGSNLQLQQSDNGYRSKRSRYFRHSRRVIPSESWGFLRN